MKVIDTSTDDPGKFTQFERDQVYNGLDCCVTVEVLEALLPQLDEHTTQTYAFSRSMQGPVLEMGIRGLLVDQQRKEQVIDQYFLLLDRLERNLERIVLEGVGMPSFNWRSYGDLHTLFYDKLQIPVIRHQGRPTVNYTALEKMNNYLIAQPIVAHILAMRDLGKKIGMLRTEIDPDGRMRTSYNIAGTSTGRFSSSINEFGTGTNLQNVEEQLRSIFIADPGMKLGKFDAKSGESYVVGAIEWNLFGDSRYLDDCDTGDVHTAAARICWPDVPWTGDARLDKKLAEQPFFRHYDRRFLCKKLGHGSNYGGLAQTLAQQSRLPVEVVQDFQAKYFKAYPSHLRWQHHVDQTLRSKGVLTSLTGRKRTFWGRRTSDDTKREAIAFDPQCSLAEIVDQGMLKVWRSRDALLYMNDHDAVTVQYPAEMEDEIVPKILDQLKVTIPLQHGRELVIPYDAKTGWNRADYSSANPEGLKDYVAGDRRQRPTPVHLLDRRVR